MLQEGGSSPGVPHHLHCTPRQEMSLCPELKHWLLEPGSKQQGQDRAMRGLQPLFFPWFLLPGCEQPGSGSLCPPNVVLGFATRRKAPLTGGLISC